MSNIAFGHSVCFSSPHYKSTLSGINECLMEGKDRFCLYSGAIKIGISLFFNLPHLCGLGGDAIIIKKNKGRISIINGTGKTGKYQNRESYQEKGLDAIPRRGVYSTMVYGAPYAFDTLVKEENIDLVRIVEGLNRDDFNKGFIKLPGLESLFDKAKSEFSPMTTISEWERLFAGEQRINHSLIHTIKRISQVGFMDLYTGKLGDEVYHQLAKYDKGLYDESDYIDFQPNYSEVKKINFLGSQVFCHGANSPWRELFLFLKIYEMFFMESKNIDYKSICKLTPYVEDAADCIKSDIVNYEDKINEIARALYDKAENEFLDERDIRHKQSHTIFIAGVNQSGDLIGITNSIFTPLGALFEVENTGILLSNRCYAFNEKGKKEDFKSQSPVKHTNNCIIVESDDMNFVIGTAGGPVQSQTLSFVINKIIAEKFQPHEAVAEPRFANLGYHAKTNKVTYLTEKKGVDDLFTSIEGLSNKLGVVQLAGINKKTGLLFSVSDPRGHGIALGY
ncbi:gamma-glutamyltransferase [Xenorhabdus szentirmaii]|uniref:Gamma-glutamyltransferase n=1 Tax=Xenorhabdus szentirmaii DSM 16338 TaxID=1427518 RepID=W1IXH8_9GAMM|nr:MULTISPECIES: gamma-glutamyltransferase [Xenorhabdus]MBD2791022.1 gamma-glutamyltransferase [Xenorhabdus sp. CUL]MBD2820154.1 gamma-glutamyltransferase [Xenorhabdus sp. 42]MBD2825242.1 gamma-glutamyltransferase [Xenorhabdus sp. 5]PHM33680.1 gamma-glutamyltransferase [Xenorhabdus szentirmaii DSM 16338]PHM42416.1 gamma-glutamyltransferase [Xenorhabdus szentirmaii]